MDSVQCRNAYVHCMNMHELNAYVYVHNTMDIHVHTSSGQGLPPSSSSLRRRAEGYHSVQHLCVGHENLLGQLAISSMCLDWFGMYHVHACIHITYSVSYHVHTSHIHGYTVNIHGHTLYMGTKCYMHIPLLYMPLRSRLYCPCKMYVLCYCTGICHFVQAGFRQGYTSQEWSGQVVSFL